MLRGPEARLRLIVALLIAALTPVLGQLVRLQVLEHQHHRDQVERLVRRNYTLPDPPWGAVLDCHGDLLVGSVPVYDVGVEVNLVTDTVMAAQELAPILGRSVEDLTAVLTMPPDTEDLVWRPLASEIPAWRAEELLARNWYWLTFTPGWERYYPEGALAAHTLGFVNREGMGYGVQAGQLRFLHGERVQRFGAVNADTSPMADELLAEGMIPYPGTDLRLTVDRTIQAYIEGALDRALTEYQAEGGTILVMDPRTGALIALASRPTYEPAHYADYAAEGQDQLFQDPAISVAYEPGSVFKIVTAAAALDSGKVDLDWSYQDAGQIEYGGVRIRNSNGAAYGQQDLAGVLAHSLNVGAATLTTRVMGAEEFYAYVRAFGFGRLTGVEVTGEAKGTVHLPTDWDWADSYLATNSFGQGIAVTPLQMATAVAAVANDGVMMQPHLIAERIYADGRQVEIPPRPLGEPMSATSARQLTELLARAVEREMTAALVPGYRIAGKSGTAQIPASGGYDREDVITSFVGYGPVSDPQVLILVKLDRPGVAPALRWGTQTAAPVFSEVATRVFVLLDSPPAELQATTN